MRNQYKVLQEAYEYILREQEDSIAPDQPDTQPTQNSEQPWWWGDFLKDKRYSSHSSFQYNVPKIPGSNEMEAVDVPAETAYWIDNVMKMPLSAGRGKKSTNSLKTQDFSAPELNSIKRTDRVGGSGIYLRYKYSGPEELSRDVKTNGKIYSALWQERKRSRETPEQTAARNKRSLDSWRQKLQKITNNFTGENIIEYIKIISVPAAYRRFIESGSSYSFFNDICPEYTTQIDNINREKNKIKIAQFLYKYAWPRDNNCPVLGVPLKPAKKAIQNYSPTLDKFEPQKGYTIGNVQFISALANRVKNRGTLEQIKMLKDFVLECEADKQKVLSKVKSILNGYTLQEPIYPKDKFDALISKARVRARKQGVPLHPMFYGEGRGRKNIIATNYIKSIFPLDMKCPILGIPLAFAEGKAKENSPTLDKIVPAEGYVPGNMIIISHLANSMKNNATPGQILQVYGWMKKHNAVPDPQIREELKQKEQQDA